MVRSRSSESVELNVTAMLDMAFQLLAFFILTFRPPPDELGFKLRLPSAKPVVIQEGRPPNGTPVNPENVQLAGANTLRIDLFSESGNLDRISVNGSPVESLDVLRQKMDALLSNPSCPIEQVVLRSGDRLKYGLMMEVVEICAEHKLPQTDKLPSLSLVAMGDAPE